MKVGFVGMGNLGREAAEVMAEHYDVIGYDIRKVNTTVKLSSSLQQAVDDRDIVFCAVQTPHDSDYDGRYPTSHLPPKDFNYDIAIEAIKEIDKYVKPGTMIALISTTLPGTVRNKIAPLVKNGRFIYNPYLIAQTTVKWDMKNPEMIIIGTEDGTETGEAVELSNFYKPICDKDTRIEIGTWDEAEGIKIFYNTFITTKLCLVNMIQDCAMKVGNMNVDVVTKALKDSTMRIMGPSYMKAGLGDGGGCHPRDNIALRWLAQEYDFGYDIFDSIVQVRELQAKAMAKFMVEQNENEIVILGTGFKPKTDQLHGSPSILVGYYAEIMGRKVHYTNDIKNVESDLEGSKYTYLIGHFDGTYDDYNFALDSTIIDPWRSFNADKRPDLNVIYYGNTRKKEETLSEMLQKGFEEEQNVNK